MCEHKLAAYVQNPPRNSFRGGRVFLCIGRLLYLRLLYVVEPYIPYVVKNDRFHEKAKPRRSEALPKMAM